MNAYQNEAEALLRDIAMQDYPTKVRAVRIALMRAEEIGSAKTGWTMGIVLLIVLGLLFVLGGRR